LISVEIIVSGCEKGSKEFRGLVIGNTGKHFSAGANLALILKMPDQENGMSLKTLS